MQEVTFEGLNNEWNFTVQERWLATLGAVGGREHKPRGAADRKEQEQRSYIDKEVGPLFQSYFL